MKLNPHPEVYREFTEFSPQTQKYLWNRLKELKSSPTGHEDIENITVQGRTVFKYVMKEGSRGGDRDHRAIFDIVENTIRIYTVFHRDKGYRKNDIAKRF